MAEVAAGKGTGELHECIVEAEHDGTHILRPVLINQGDKFPARDSPRLQA